MERHQEILLSDKTGEKRYSRGKLLGTGGFAKCFEAVSLADRCTYALKVIPKKEINEKRKRYKLMLEIKLHRSLKHRNIVGFRDVFEDSENVYIVLEYCRNNTLKELVKRRKRITQWETRVYMLQMVKALQYIHRQSIVHRDLKLGNILISQSMQLKLCDFGLSTRISYQGEKKRTVCGTPNYIAPEILEEEGHSYESDIWSLGVILYALLFGKPPFESNTVEETYENIRNNKYSIPDIGISAQARDLIKHILLTDPARRLTLQDIRKHPFMESAGQIPRNLPIYTLAIPPHNIPELPHKKDDLDVDKSLVLKMGLVHSESISIPELQFSGKPTRPSKNKQQSKVVPMVFAVQTLIYKGSLGYLLSDGTISVMFDRDRSQLSQRYGQPRCSYLQKQQDKVMSVRLVDPTRLEPALVQKYNMLTYYSSFFELKYKASTLKKMSKQQRSQSNPIYIRKKMKMEVELLLRFSNGCVELCFQDLSCLLMNRNDDQCLYYVDKMGNQRIIEYEGVDDLTDTKLQKKVKKFSKLLAAIWAKATEGTEIPPPEQLSEIESDQKGMIVD